MSKTTTTTTTTTTITASSTNITSGTTTTTITTLPPWVMDLPRSERDLTATRVIIENNQPIEDIQEQLPNIVGNLLDEKKIQATLARVWGEDEPAPAGA